MTTHAEGIAEFMTAYEATGVLLHVESWQMLSRNNDRNGNPYRLVLAYLVGGGIVGFEERSSMPNIVSRKFSKLAARQLPTFHLSPSEYNNTKKHCCYPLYEV
jgi:hypothetical protein